MAILERDFQAKLIRELKNTFDGSIIIKNDPNYIQGFPDLTILYENRWALLECKKSASEHRQPNQEYYINLADRMSFGRFIFPENKDEVMHELYLHFKF